MNKAKIISAGLSASLLLLNASSAFASTVEVSGNGADSSNTANLSLNQVRTIQQQNTADVQNTAKVDANTGSNEANDNTGGDVSIGTGDAMVKVGASTSVNTNSADGCCADNFDILAKISGNGADSYNKLNLSLNNENNIYSTNVQNIRNRFYINANTGDNEANGNTGGDVNITTGNIMVDLLLNNSGNSNVAICCVAKNGEVTPPTPTTPGVTPGVPAVLGAESLPMTGFDYPIRLILLTSVGLVAAGMYLRKNSDALESLLRERISF